eukprot:TRINITY_DN1417_c0_g1_i2.p2 TRINITY_DN1417_c0_g1~~TRINITY_DN1417_c0_g1_i2.p2  ORF type:complete len:293 (-),score=40.24 TRINITY_DN1417_c0_g1_i2:1203-2081(-)
MGSSVSSTSSRLVQVGPGFWNIRGSFKVLAGIVNIGTHMSIVQLSSGKFLVVDTIPLDPELKSEIDALTNNGRDMEAVIATHPFHTLAFNGFYEAYPDVPFYGTPRHLRNIKNIPWFGCIGDPQVMATWLPDVELRIPDGAEWERPVPESTNHFNCCWVYSPAAKTVHVDDTFNYVADPPFIARIVGLSKDQLSFHPSMHGPGLHHTEQAPYEFKAWLEQVLNDWDFDNMCCAHVENKIGGAHAAVKQALLEAEPTLEKLSKRAKNHPDQGACGKHKGEDSSKYNVSGHECG